MLQIVVPGTELFDESTQTFRATKDTVLNLEHSLISLSKWESKHHKPFLSLKNKTPDEILDYVRCMTINSNVDPDVYLGITNENITQINDYINDPMTATWFNESRGGKKNRQIVTSEVLYSWMVGYQIPFECEKWHLNRLITLIRVCEVNNSKDKKMPMREVIADRKRLNEERRKQANTKG